MKNLERTMDDLRMDAGEDLANAILKLIKEDAAVDWFYNTAAPTFEGKTPFEYCKEKGRKEVLSALYSILDGNCY